MTPEGLTIPADIETPTNPFPGLRPFEFGESHLYFGRDGQSDQLIRKLSATRFVAVVGTSGSGKSSLVRAGLLPDLFSGFMSSAGSHWRVCLMRPSNDPLGNLARSLCATSVFGSEIEENRAVQTAITEATLRRGSLGLVEVVRQNRQPSNESLLVVVDQFEELFRFARVSASEQYRYEAAAFVKLLLEAARQREHNVYVVLTMRSDFLGDCSIFWDLPEAINEGQYLIPRMTRDQRAEAITGPIAVCGGHVTQRLVNRLLNDTGDNPDLLPILQHALMRTWERWAEDHEEGEPVDLRHYEAIGTMSDALSRHADEAFNELSNEREQLIAERAFKALTEKGEDNREVRRPTVLAELCALTAATEPEVVSVLEVFRREGRSFLMPPSSVALDEDSLIDISHESLIRNWQRLRDWVTEEAQSARIYRRLAETTTLHLEGDEGLLQDPALQIALDWRERNKSNATWGQRYHPAFDSAMKFLDESVSARDAAVLAEERRRRREIKRTRVAAAIFFLLFMLSLAALTYANSQRKEAQKKNAEAQEALRQVEEANRQANADRATAIAARDDARRSEGAAQEAKEDALEKKREAEESKAEAVKQAEIARLNARKAEEANRVIKGQKDSIESAAVNTRRLLYAADMNRALQAYDASNVAVARGLLGSHTPATGDSLGFEWYYLWKLFHGESDTLNVQSGAGNSIALSRDGRMFAVAADRTVELWDAVSRKETGRIESEVQINSLALSPDGRLLAIGSISSVELIDIGSRQTLATLNGHEGEVDVVVFSPDGKLLASGSFDHTVRLWDVVARREVAKLDTVSWAGSVAFSGDGKALAAGNIDGDVMQWEVSPLKQMFKRHAFSSSVVSLAFMPNGGLLAAGGSDGTVRTWNYYGDERNTFTRDGTPVSCVAFSPDGEALVASYVDGTIKLWDTGDSVREPVTLKGHGDAVNSMAFSTDGKLLITGSADGSVKFWEVAVPILEQSSLKEDGVQNISVVAFSPDGQRLATGGYKSVKVWRADTHQELCSGEGGSGSVKSVAFSPDGQRLATGGEVTGNKEQGTYSEDGNVVVWDARSCGELAKLQGHTGTVTSVAFSPDGQRLATGSTDRTVKLWDTGSFKEMRTLPTFTRSVMSVTFSRDGKLLAVGGGDGTVRLWDIASSRELSSLSADAGAVYSLAFSPDGRALAAAFEKGLVKLWGAATGEELAAFRGHKGSVFSLSFSPDGRTLATGGEDRTVKLWSTTSFKELVTLKWHTDAVISIAFSSDGKTLASAGFDRQIRLWRAATDEEVNGRGR